MTILDEFEELVCFAAITQAGSITAAARMLGRSKAHVSRRLVELESRIGTKLMHRSTRKLVTTDTGEQLKAEALQLFKSGQLLSLRATGLDDEPKGKFTITASYSVMAFLIGPYVKEMQETFPNVNFKLLATNEPLDLVAEGIDMGVRTGNVVDDRLIARQIGVAHDKFFYSPDKYKISEPIENLSDLLGHRLLINNLSFTGESIKLTNGEQTAHLTPPKVTVVCEQPFLINLVLQGCGIGLASDYRISELSLSGQVRPLLTDWHAKQWPVFMVYPFLSPLPTKLARISEFLRSKLASHLALDHRRDQF